MDASRVSRILDIYTRLLDGEQISKVSAAKEYEVSERSIQRDVENIRVYFDEAARRGKVIGTLAYDRTLKCYHFVKAE